MAQNLAYFQNAFKNFGKLITVINNVATQVAAFDTLAMQTLGLANDGSVLTYNHYLQVASPFVQSVNSLVSSLNGMATSAQTAANTYLTKVIAVDLGLAANSSVAQAAAAFATQASGAAAVVTPSGSNIGTATATAPINSFAAWFGQTYGVTLYQNGVGGNVQDGWIAASGVVRT